MEVAVIDAPLCSYFLQVAMFLPQIIARLRFGPDPAAAAARASFASMAVGVSRPAKVTRPVSSTTQMFMFCELLTWYPLGVGRW